MHYLCSEFKNISEPEPHLLADLEEARDVLIKVLETEGYCIAIFKFGAVTLPMELMDQLEEMIGKRCAVLRFDGSYRLRCLDEEVHA